MRVQEKSVKSSGQIKILKTLQRLDYSKFNFYEFKINKKNY